VALAVVLPAPTASARSAFSADVPNGLVHDCAACHVDINIALNVTWFGADIALTYDDYVNPRPVWAEVYFLDSDEDGQTNGEELGDPCGLWVWGDDAPADEASNPGDAASVLDEVVPYDCGEPADDDDSADEPVEVTSCIYSIAGERPGPWFAGVLPLWLLLRRHHHAGGGGAMSRWLAAAGIAALLAAAGCGVPVDLQPGDGEGGFPHPDDYVREHMDDAEQDDEGCFDCHGVDSDDPIEGSTTLHCSLCHAYPPVHLGDEP